MNDGLDRYQNEQKVTGITGFSHFGDTFSYPCESYFNTLSGTSWSWATWSDRWKYFDADCDDWTDMVSDKKLRKAFNYDNTYDFYKIMSFPVGPFLAGGAAAVYCMRLGGWMI